MHKGQRTLTCQLEAFRTGLLARLPPHERKAVLAAEDLRIAIPDRKAIGAGAAAPSFALPNQYGQTVRLADYLAHGPVVLLFIRGGWCPFCTLTLRAYQEALPDIQAAGADLLAIGPQPFDSCSAVAERDLLAFSVLSDAGNAVAEQFGVVYEIAPDLQKLYVRLGHDLPRVNQSDDWRVPLPATFIIGTDGRVIKAHVAETTHRRLEPSDLVGVLERLRTHA